MLHNEHMKLGKDLQRRIAKLREENKDPALPQKPTRTSSAANPSSSAVASPPQPIPSPPPQPPTNTNTMSDSQQTVDESFMLLGQRVRKYSFVYIFWRESGMSDMKAAIPSAPSRAQRCSAWVLIPLQFRGAESFRGHNTDNGSVLQSDPGDAFHQFWKATEGMLEYLSRPVAFATAPLAPEEPPKPSPSPSGRRGAKTRDGNSSSDTDFEDPISRKISRGISLVKAAHSRMLTKYDSVYGAGGSGAAAEGSGSSIESGTFPPPPQPSHAIDLRDDWDDDIRAFDGELQVYNLLKPF